MWCAEWLRRNHLLVAVQLRLCQYSVTCERNPVLMQSYANCTIDMEISSTALINIACVCLIRTFNHVKLNLNFWLAHNYSNHFTDLCNERKLLYILIIAFRITLSFFMWVLNVLNVSMSATITLGVWALIMFGLSICSLTLRGHNIPPAPKI